MKAPMFFAKAHGKVCEGPERCYWCGDPCTRQLLHGQPRPLTGQKGPNVAVPCSHWQCLGCHLYEKKNTTVFMPDGSRRFQQSPINWSLLVTADEIVAFKLGEHDDFLYETCNKPPQPPYLLLVTTMPGKHFLANAVLADGEQLVINVNGQILQPSKKELASFLRNTGSLENLIKKNAGLALLVQYLRQGKKLLAAKERQDAAGTPTSEQPEPAA